MSMPRAVRHINETRVLEALFRSGAMSRADLARSLHLTRSTAGNLVAGLVGLGLLLEDTAEAGGRIGRPGAQVRLNGPHAVFLGAVIGIGHLVVVALDLAANPVGRASRSFDPERADPAAVVAALAALTRSIIAALPPGQALRGLGVAIPGLLDQRGNIVRAPILGWRDVPILALLEAALPDLPLIAVENDANAFAAADRYHAGAAAAADAIYMLLDAGVGGGIVSDGALLRGHDRHAGEIGHIIVGDHGFAPKTALPGSLESFVGREAVLGRHRVHGGTADTIEAFDRDLGDRRPAALATLAEWSHYLGRGIATLVSVLNPATIVMGGPLSVLLRHDPASLDASVRRHLLANHPIPGLVVSALGPDGAAIGAASMLHRDMLALDEELVFNGRRPS